MFLSDRAKATITDVYFSHLQNGEYMASLHLRTAYNDQTHLCADIKNPDIQSRYPECKDTLKMVVGKGKTSNQFKDMMSIHLSLLLAE